MKRFLLYGLFLIFVSCSSDDNGNGEEVFEPQEVEFSLIAKGHISSSINVETEDFVIYDNESWEELYETLTPYSGQTIDFQETEIDFDAYQILASFDEVRPYPGWVIDIESVIEKTNQIDVLVKVYQDYIGLTPWSTRQIHIVKIPRSDKPVVFERIFPEGS